jgi:carbonic anhydrase
VESNGQGTGSDHIDAIVKAVEPGLQLAKKHCDACTGEPNCAEKRKNEFVECVSDASAKHVAAMLPGQSKILKDMVATQKIKIVAAKYDLDDGTVTLFK